MTEREIQVRIAERNDQGSSAEQNRDALGHASLFAGNLLVLATGTGGTGTGRVEANLAVSTVLTQFRQLQEAGIPQRLAAALSHANDVLRTRANGDPQLSGSGASVATALIRDNEFYAARAGNVRVLIVRGERAIDAVGYDMEDLPSAEGGNAAASVGAAGAGQHARIVVSREPIRLLPGDRVVLVAPGLYEHVDTVAIGRAVTSYPAQEAVARLVETAQKAGASRGVSIQLLQYGDPLPAEVTARAPGGAVRAQTGAARAAVGPEPGGRAAQPRAAAPSPAPIGPSPSPTGPSRATPPQSAPSEMTPDAARPRAVRPSAGMPLVPTVPADRETSLSEPISIGRRASEALRGAQPNGRRSAIISAAIAAFALMVLLLWRPWSSAPAEEPTEPVAAAPEQSAPDEPVRSLLDRSAAIAAAPLPAEPIEEEPAEVLEMEPMGTGAGAATSFWAHFDRAVESGDRIDEARVTAWLGEEGDDLAEAAAARSAQIADVALVLERLAVPEATLNTKDAATLDRIFAAAPGESAEQLKSFIEREHGRRGDEIFATVSSWLRTHRTPEAFATIVQLAQRRLGPKTKAWVLQTAPKDLLGAR